MGDRNEDPRDSSGSSDDSSNSSDDSSNSSDDSSSDSEDDGSIRDHRSSKSVDHRRSSPVDPESDSSDSEASSLDPGEQQHATKAAAGSEDSSDSSADSSSDSSGSHDSPSNSSDSSSEDSSSDDSSSESEPEELPTRTLSNSHKNLQSFEPPQLPTTTPVSDAPSQTPPVAPGQGLSKTQRRNARRKLDSTTHEGNETSQSLGSPEESGSTQRRVKPNIGAARRMLMGSLGLKNPKSKADEDKIRQDLMKGVRPHTNARLTEPSPQPEESAHTQESVDEDPEAWREKISYRAVECCHDGIELSEPPFPFVQRWDPQQQIESWFGTKNKRGGKRKRAQQDQAQVPEDGDSQESKKRRLTGGGVTFSDAVESMEEGNTTLNYDDPVEEAPVANGQPLESQAIDFEDLPSLPSDLTSLPPLLPGKAIAGMVITWKQLVLSPATNWQPEVVNLTGVLVRVYDEDATDLEFLLAQRDRNLDRTEKVYDEITGKRVYDRFEAPDDDEEDESEADDGYRRLTFAELIEPKILQEPLGEKETPKGQEESSGPTDSVIHETVYDDQSQPSHANEEMTGQSEAGEGSQSQDVAEESQANANTDDGQSHNGIDSQRGVSERDQPSSNVESQPEHAAEQNAEDDVSTPKASTNPPKATEDDSQQSTSSLGQALSISSDRRHEISLMIAEAGFRKDVTPSNLRARTNSPSRQLMEMSGAIDDSQPLSEMTAAKENTPIASKEQTAGTEGVPPPSSASSVRSGRQPDTDFSFDMGGDDMPHIGDTGGGSPVLGETTPRAEVQTPKRGKQASVEPSTRDSVDFPGLDQLFLTATSQQHTQDSESPSKSQVLSELQSRKVIVRRDEEYEAAMRRLDDEEDDEEDEEEEESQSPRPFRRTRKQLFPNSSQPMPSRSPELPDIKPVIKTAPSSFSEATDAWPSTRTRKRTSSPFVLPEGSQVISLSSRSSSPVEEYIELYAEDDIDEDYEEKSSSLPHGAGWVQMNKPPRAKSRAKSMPAARAGHKAAGGRRSIPPSTVPEMSKKSRGSRKSSAGL
ncbi:hypothetical protein CPLU01_06824 [Colletotrichum plurivorum]|uniref:Uncharacterized protein n=1 Tax=Colletotrichum plurivorum TaxID=2175906 RepID=A0A8H6KGN1_9PEZI|nr:hypothetical protein CPLU01_06824 [Colletotrichum plurivorum]